MIGGYVLDASAIAAFGRFRERAVLAIDRVDKRAQTLLIPAVAMTEALCLLTDPDEARRAQLLLDLGVVVDDDLTRERCGPVSMAYLKAEDSEATSLGMAHSVVVARDREWPVLTDLPNRWRAAYPGVELASLC